MQSTKLIAYDVTTFSVQYDVIRAIESEASSSMGQYHDMTPVQHQSTLKRIVDLCEQFRRAVTCRTDDTILPPRATGPVPRAGPSARRSAPAAQSGAPPRPPVTMITTCLDQHFCTRQVNHPQTSSQSDSTTTCKSSLIKLYLFFVQGPARRHLLR